MTDDLNITHLQITSNHNEYVDHYIISSKYNPPSNYIKSQLDYGMGAVVPEYNPPSNYIKSQHREIARSIRTNITHLQITSNHNKS